MVYRFSDHYRFSASWCWVAAKSRVVLALLKPVKMNAGSCPLPNFGPTVIQSGHLGGGWIVGISNGRLTRQTEQWGMKKRYTEKQYLYKIIYFEMYHS